MPLNGAVCFLIGISFWAAGWAPLFDEYNLPLQPVELLVILCLPFTAWRIRQLNFPAVLLVSILVFACALARPNDQFMMLVWAWQMILPPLFCLVLALLWRKHDTAQWMLKGFVIAGAASAVLALLQVLTLSSQLDWRNNILFSLPPQFARGFALLPEASTLAVHLMLAMTVMVIFEFPKRRSIRWPFYAVMGGSLIWTASSSIFIVGPIALGLIWWVLPRSRIFWPILLFALAIALISWGVSIEERSAVNANTRSAAIRLSTMIAGLMPVLEAQILGNGIGSQSLIAQEALDVARRMGLRFGSMPQGINSFVISQIYEQGSLAFLLYLSVFAIHLRGLRTTGFDQKLAATGLLCLAISAFVVGYRGIYLNWMPFACAMALLSRQIQFNLQSALAYTR